MPQRNPKQAIIFIANAIKSLSRGFFIFVIYWWFILPWKCLLGDLVLGFVVCAAEGVPCPEGLEEGFKSIVDTAPALCVRGTGEGPGAGTALTHPHPISPIPLTPPSHFHIQSGSTGRIEFRSQMQMFGFNCSLSKWCFIKMEIFCESVSDLTNCFDGWSLNKLF